MSNPNAKCLKFGDGMAMFGGAVAFTEKRHLAVRNAIEAHRKEERKPLSMTPNFTSPKVRHE